MLRKAMITDQWAQCYSRRHRLERVADFPIGIIPPSKVRVYRRRDHYILQWWNPSAKNTASVRVNGDLIDALSKARAIDEQITTIGTAGCKSKRFQHDVLVELFLHDLTHRANAGEVTPGTVQRYGSALDHYLRFVQQSEIRRSFPFAIGVNREFALRFAAYLRELVISPNGHPNTHKQIMCGSDYVLDTVRAMFEWTIDPDRGNQLPAEFRNPFRRASIQRRKPATDMTGEPDITVPMAVEFIDACDMYQLTLFTPIICYGLRASEPIFLFYENIDLQWMTVGCIPQLCYTTKGLRNKRLPLIDPIRNLFHISANPIRQGLVHVRRCVVEDKEQPRLLGADLAKLSDEYEKRIRQSHAPDAGLRIKIRDQVLRQAGAMTYDGIQGEFRRIAQQLRWPAVATIKDFRHLFSTTMANGAMPEHERRYLMGHAPGKEAIVSYTHLNKIAAHYRNAIKQEFDPVLQMLRKKIA